LLVTERETTWMVREVGDAKARRAQNGAAGRAWRFGVLAGAYALFAWLGRFVPTIDGVALFWLPTGIALALLWRWGPSYWPAILVGALVHALLTGLPPAVALGFAVASAAGPYVAVELARRYGFVGGDSRRELIALAAAAALGVTLSAVIGPCTLFVAGRVPLESLGRALLSWWLGDVAGIVLATPLLLSFSVAAARAGFRRRPLQVIALAALTIVVGFAVSGLAPGMHDARLPVSFLAVPPMAWAALRFGVPGASLATLVIAGFSFGGVAAGRGPFILADANLGYFLLWAHLVTLGLLGLLATLLRAELVGAETRLSEKTQALRESQALHEELVRSLPVGVYRARSRADGSVAYEYASPLFLSMLDLPPQSVQSPTFRAEVLRRIHPDDHAALERVIADGRATSAQMAFEGRVNVRGETRWMRFEIAQRIVDNGERVLFGIVADISERRRLELQQANELTLLEGLAHDRPLPALLADIITSYETAFPGALGSVLLLDADRRRLRHGAAPSLPAAYVAAIDGIEIGPAAGSCGTAAWSRKTVIVADIAVDPRWAAHRALAEAHGLAACWSVPLHSTRQQVLGTFAIYYRMPRAPGPEEITAIERVAYLASVAIERHSAKAELAQSEARHRNLYNNTPSMQYSIDPQGVLVDVSDYWLAVMGYRRDEVIGRPLASVLTPASARFLREVGLPDLLRTGVAHNVEYQQVKKTGEVIDVLASSTTDRDAGGRVVGALWSLADITARKRLETQRAHENTLLEAMASGASLDEALLRLIYAYQALLPGMVGSVLLVEPDGRRLGHGLAPGLPEAFRKAVDGLEIGPQMCSCGAAAYTGKRTVVADIAADPLWGRFRDLALANGLAACWSFPIIDSNGRPVGTFAQYYREVRSPTADEIALVERGAWLASLAIERARALDGLRESEERFRDFYNETPAMLYSCDGDGRLVSVSDYWLAATGYRREEVTGSPLSDFLQEDGRRLRSESGAAELLRTGRRMDAPYRLIRKSGELMDVIVSSTAEHRPDGGIVRSLSVMTDVTERNRAEESLRQHGDNLDALHRFTLDLLDRRDMTDLLQTIVDRATAMVSSRYGSLLLLEDDTLIARAHTRDVPLFAESPVRRDAGVLAWRAIDSGEAVVFDDYVNWPQRRTRFDPLALRAVAVIPVLLRGTSIGVLELARDEPGRPFTPAEIRRGALFAQMAALVIDHVRVYEDALRQLAERARAEAALREQEARLAGIIDSAIDAIITVDEEHRIVVFNDAAARIFGWATDAVLGRSLVTLIPEYRAVLDATRDVASRGPGASAPVRGLRQGGAEFPIEVSVSRVAVGGRELVTVTVRDITEQLRARASEARLQAELRESQKLEAIGTLAGGIAHEFNNIVGSILGNAELAQQDVGPDGAAGASIEEIRKAGLRARDVIRQILAFSRNEPVERGRIDLCAIVEATLRMLRPIVPAGIEMRTRLPETRLYVEGDAGQLQQALVNLCNNGLYALGAGPGSLEVTLDTLDIGGTAPPGLGRGQFAHLAVCDSGVGMDAATVGRIFEPFFTTREAGGGTGLGLSVVHGIVKSHHGRIDVASEPGHGSTFHVYLPLIAPPPPRTEAVGAALTGATPHGHVLYVDDDEALVFLVTRVLARHGLKVTGHHRAADALAAIRAEPAAFDLLLTDFNMPEMSGVELAQHVGSIRADLPIVLTSGFITDEVRAAAIHAGIRHLIYKPNTVDELCNVVLRLVRESVRH
jgi:PAS domain S-box-containing protein